MLRSRIIPCLDVADGRVVKGVQFVDITVSLHARVIFEEAFTAEQAGSSAVAAAGVYFHGFSLPSIDYQTLIVPTPNRTLAIRK